jgi:hypothetical protein
MSASRHDTAGEPAACHLLKTFINPDQHTTHAVVWQVIIHVAFLVSAVVMAWVDRLTTHAHPEHFHEGAAARPAKSIYPPLKAQE